MADEILEYNGQKYKRSSLIDFGKNHDNAANKCKSAGVFFSVCGLIVLISYLLMPVVSTNWWLLIIFPVMIVYAFGGVAAMIVTVCIAGTLLLIGAGLLVYAAIDRSEEHYLEIARYYIDHDVRE